MPEWERSSNSIGLFFTLTRSHSGTLTLSVRANVGETLSLHRESYDTLHPTDSQLTGFPKPDTRPYLPDLIEFRQIFRLRTELFVEGKRNVHNDV